MEKIDIKFNKFLNLSLKVLFIIVILGAFGELYPNIHSFKLLSLSCSLGIAILTFAIYYILKHNYNKYLIISSIFFLGFLIRFIWFFSIDSLPSSDFNTIYLYAMSLLKGDTSVFKGTSYIARFPHLTVTVLYFSLIQDLFKNALSALRFINVIFSAINMILIFFISKEVFQNEKKSIWTLFISAVYPPMIIYNNVYCTENMALPLFLLSVLLFLKSFSRQNKFALLTASILMLSLANLFRPVAFIFLTAYIMYVFIYFKENFKIKLIMLCSIILSFVLPIIIVSYTLISLKIIENPLWHGKEPSSTSILKGTNLETYGRWSEEDSVLFDKFNGDYDLIDSEAKRLIKERLFNTSLKDLAKLYIVKYSLQWSSGDFGGIDLTEYGLIKGYNKDFYLSLMGKTQGRMLIKLSDDGAAYVQIIYIFMVILTYIGFYKRTSIKNLKIDLFYILFCGFAIQCLITESQDRYTYAVSWIFIFLAITAFNE